MYRSFVVLAVAVAASACLSAAPRLKTPDPTHPVGKWRIVFANGVIETCDIEPDGTAAEAEPLRSSTGKWKEVDGAVVVTFDDDRLERWKNNGARWQVEHWCPASAFPTNPLAVGTAKRE
jgi:hypothetical protein